MTQTLRLQWIGWVTAAVGAASLFVFVSELQPFRPVDPGGFVSLGSLVLAVGSVGVLAAAFPAVAKKINHAEPTQLNVFPLDPATTPAIRLLVGLITTGSLLLLTVLVLQTASWILLVQSYVPSPEMNAAYAIGFGIVVAAILRAAIVPTFHLRAWIVRMKMENLRRLSRSVERIDESALQRLFDFRGRRKDTVSEFFQVAATEDGPFRAATLVQFGAALVGSLFAFAISFISKVI